MAFSSACSRSYHDKRTGEHSARVSAALYPSTRPHPFLGYNGPVKTYRFPVVIESDSDGFFAYCPDLQGCYTQGRTFEEALTNIRDAARLHLEDRLSMGERIGSPD